MSDVPARYEPTIDPELTRILKDQGLSMDQIMEMVKDPTRLNAFERAYERFHKAGKVAVWQALMKKALEGDTTAMKEYMKRFDDGYRDRGGVDGVLLELPSKDAMIRLLEAKYGPEVVAVARAAAAEHGDKYGAFEEELLPGGDHEDDIEIIDADVVEDEPEDEPDDDLDFLLKG